MSFLADDETEGGIIIKKDTFYVVALNVLSYLLVRNKIYVPVMITEKRYNSFSCNNRIYSSTKTDSFSFTLQILLLL